MEEVKVSIWCITYNHEPYIKDAIESFLAQKTNFTYEIVIHDDASTDGTAEIVKDYEKRYPNLIHGIYQTENQFRKEQPSLEWLWKIQEESCTGKYIAVCEGDDYWIDRKKLQLQVDYLETHSDCMMAVHDTIDMDYRQHKVSTRRLYAKEGIISADDIIIKRIIIPTASMVYRKELCKMDKIFLNVGYDDYPCLLYCLTKGEIYYFNRIMSLYRQNHEGSWSMSVGDINLYLFQNIWEIVFLIKYNRYSEWKFENYVVSKIQTHVDAILSIFKRMTKEGFLKLSERYGGKSNIDYGQFFLQMKRLVAQLSDADYIDEDTLEFVQKYKKVYIMGAGKYAGILAAQFERHMIPFEGFLISKGQQSMQSYMGKPVWELNGVSHDVKDVGVVIGINPVNWWDIVDSLWEANISNFICPFLLKLQETVDW